MTIALYRAVLCSRPIDLLVRAALWVRREQLRLLGL